MAATYQPTHYDFKISKYNFRITDDAGIVAVTFWHREINLDDPLFYRAMHVANDLARTLEAIIELETVYDVYTTIFDLEALKDMYFNDYKFRSRVDDWMVLATRQDSFPVSQMGIAIIDFIRQLKKQEVPQVQPLPKARPGFVYILKSDTGHYKIGRAIDPENRLRTFGVKLPFKVEYELLIPSDDYIKLEAELHARFHIKHVSGEWFALVPEDIEALRKEYNNE
jgi:hypothetical protein